MSLRAPQHKVFRGLCISLRLFVGRLLSQPSMASTQFSSFIIGRLVVQTTKLEHSESCRPTTDKSNPGTLRICEDRKPGRPKGMRISLPLFAPAHGQRWRTKHWPIWGSTEPSRLLYAIFLPLVREGRATARTVLDVPRLQVVCEFSALVRTRPWACRAEYLQDTSQATVRTAVPSFRLLVAGFRP